MPRKAKRIVFRGFWDRLGLEQTNARRPDPKVEASIRRKIKENQRKYGA